MSQQVRVSRDLEFVGVAAHQRNVKGPINPEMMVLYDHFTGIALDTTNVWATSLPGTSDTIAINEAQGGTVRLTTGTVDDDSCMLASAIICSGTKKAICEVKVTITDVSGTGLFVGFSDAKLEVNNSIAIHYPADSLTTVASNAAGFVIDADHATSSIMCASVKADVDTTPVDTAVDWADGETRTLRVELDTDGGAAFYIGDDLVAYIANSVTAATLLCVTVQAITRANDGANTVDVDKTAAWQDE